MDDNGVRIELKGWKGLVALLLVGVAFLGFRVWRNHDFQTSPEVRRKLEQVLQTTVLQDGRWELQGALQAVENGNERAAADLANRVISRTAEIHDYRLRGSGEDIIVKVNYTVTEAGGSQQKRTDYYRFSHSMITGWVHRGPATEWSWKLALF